MFDIGFVEMLVIAIVGMVVIGPERLPGVARSIGRSVGQLQRFLKNLQRQLEQEVDLEELRKCVRDDPKQSGSKSEPSDEVEPPMPPFTEQSYTAAPVAASAEPATASQSDFKKTAEPVRESDDSAKR